MAKNRCRTRFKFVLSSSGRKTSSSSLFRTNFQPRPRPSSSSPGNLVLVLVPDVTRTSFRTRTRLCFQPISSNPLTDQPVLARPSVFKRVGAFSPHVVPCHTANSKSLYRDLHGRSSTHFMQMRTPTFNAPPPQRGGLCEHCAIPHGL